MKHLRGKQWAGAITIVGVQQGDDYFEYDGQATIKLLIIENNSAHFCHTKNTPPMTEPLLLELGYLSNTEAARQILEVPHCHSLHFTFGTTKQLLMMTNSAKYILSL
jgi:hypothetical protein